MARYFAPITISELKTKLEALDEHNEGLVYVLKEKLSKDLKVKFDLENFYSDGDGLLGYHTLPNGLALCGFKAGGDWESPVAFFCYYDGKKIRGYVPTDGNPWNTTTKEAYGNDPEADTKNAKKRWPELYDTEDMEDWDADSGNFDFDWDAIQKDIEARILPQGQPVVKAQKPVAKKDKKQSIQQRVEACAYYGTGDEGYELFQKACSFCYSLYGLGNEDKSLVVCEWIEDMSKESEEWAEQEGFLGIIDTEHGHWGN